MTNEKEFVVLGLVTISVRTIVKAENEVHAKAIARMREPQRLAIDDADETTEWCHSGELDGEVEFLEIDRDASPQQKTKR